MQVVEAMPTAPVSTLFARHYAASKESCPRARRDVAQVFSSLGMSDDAVFAASVVFSELFTNAILHHKPGNSEKVHVALQENREASQHWVGIAVTDGGSGNVQPAKDIVPSREGFGRGLEVVRGLGARLTDVRVPGGYTVTAWTPLSDVLRQRVCRCDCPTAHRLEPSACSWLIEERGEWEAAVRDDRPGAHLCSECRRLYAAAANIPPPVQAMEGEPDRHATAALAAAGPGQ